MAEKLALEIQWIPLSRINELPSSTGVYVFQGNKEELYIGKAVNIRSRVKSHFQQPGYKDKVFIDQVEKIGFITTESEIEALVLEANLIKQYFPKYNVMWRDDKNFFYVGITKEEFSRVFVTHQPLARHPEGGQASGRPTKGSRSDSTGFLPAARLTPACRPPLIAVRQVAGEAGRGRARQGRHGFASLRGACAEDGFAARSAQNDCLYIGPFVDGKALKNALKMLRRVIPFRTCRTLPDKPCLWYQLGQCPAPCHPKSENQKSRIKDICKKNIKNLVHILEGSKGQALKRLEKEMRQASQRKRFEEAGRIRDQIRALESVLAHSHVLEQIPKKKINWSQIERQLKKILNIKAGIKRIEGYDISNLQGKEATGSMVVFNQAAPDKSEYRRFRIKTKKTPDDTAMLREVLKRRFKHQEWDLPQIMLIDGGKAQLNAVVKIKNQISKTKVKDKNVKRIQNIRTAALAKQHSELFVEGKKDPLLLRDLAEEVANLLLRIRDEAHRFAIKYHKTLRKKSLLK